jgi:hypothetical protein
MASSKGQVTLRGRFSPGDVVTLTKVAGPHVLRPEGGEAIETQTVTEEKDAPRVGYVRFSKGVEIGARYFIHGLHDGRPQEVRITGKSSDDPSEVFEQAPIMPDRMRLTDGSFVDDAPTKESAPNVSVGPADIRHVSKGTVLRSDTPRGEAHPLDPEERAPKRSQEDVKKGVVQMSDTRPREEDGQTVGGGGEAAELVVGPQRQEDVPKGAVQRSDTPTGVSTVIPAGDTVQQAQDRESSFAKETRGEPVRAAAEPIDAPKVNVGAPSGSTQKDSEQRDADLKKSEREAAALAVPIADMAPSAGEDSDGTDDEEAERRSKAAKKAARTRKRNEKKAAAESAPEQGSKSSGPTTGAATTSNTTAKEK